MFSSDVFIFGEKHIDTEHRYFDLCHLTFQQDDEKRLLYYYMFELMRLNFAFFFANSFDRSGKYL